MKKWKEVDFKEKICRGLFYVFVCPSIFTVGLMLASSIKETKRASRKEREKIRRFKPTIRDTFWGQKIDWTLRDKPLTDEQLKGIKL